MGILGIQALSRRLIGGKAQKVSRGEKDVFNKSDLWAQPGADILCTAGEWVKIGEYTVGPGEELSWGFGVPELPDNQGYLYMANYDDTATNSVIEEGKVRLVVTNPLGRNSEVAIQFDSITAHGSTTDRQQQTPLPEQTNIRRARENDKMQVYINPAASDTIVETAIGTAAGLDIWQLPVTRYALR